jgi:hypothetical protein
MADEVAKGREIHSQNNEKLKIGIDRVAPLTFIIMGQPVQLINERKWLLTGV